MLRTMLLLLTLLMLSGCSSQGEKSADTGDTYDVSKVKKSLTENDESFIRELMVSASAVQRIIEDFDEYMAEAQQHDEYDGALQIMEESKKAILYRWNKVHNGPQPDDRQLQKLQVHYEGILDRYRRGIDEEWEGMRNGDAGKMKEGFKKTEEAKADFANFSKDIEKLKKQG